MSLRILTAENIKQLVDQLSLSTLLSQTAEIFYQFSHRPEEVQCPPRFAIEGERYTTLAMPAHVSGLGSSVKMVAVPKPNANTNANTTGAATGGSVGTETAKSIGLESGCDAEPSNSGRVRPPGTPARRPGLAATTVVFDEESGRARTVLNARHLTALRTAAGSVLASLLLLSKPGSRAGPKPRTVAFFGAGLQIEYHASLLLQAFPSIESCYILNRSLSPGAIALVDRLARAYPTKRIELFSHSGNGHPPRPPRSMQAPGTGPMQVPCTASPTPASAANAGPEERFEERLEERLEERFDASEFESTGAQPPRPHALPSLLLEADILCSATSATSPLVDAASIKPGAHLILVGSYHPGMHEVPTAVVQRASKVVVDARDHAMREAGELIDASLDPNRDLVELGELVDDRGQPVRDTIVTAQQGDITIFKSVGLAVQDVMIAHLLCTMAEASSIGTVIDGFD